eukprot:COSAG02_NODE_254_length_26937_cov_16.503950_11_plen_82_part_00
MTGRRRHTFLGARLGLFLQVLLGGARDEREEGETLVLVARVNGRGRLIPAPALNKTMFHRVAGGLEDPHFKKKPYIVLYNQ